MTALCSNHSDSLPFWIASNKYFSKIKIILAINQFQTMHSLRLWKKKKKKKVIYPLIYWMTLAYMFVCVSIFPIMNNRIIYVWISTFFNISFTQFFFFFCHYINLCPCLNYFMFFFSFSTLLTNSFRFLSSISSNNALCHHNRISHYSVVRSDCMTYLHTLMHKPSTSWLYPLQRIKTTSQQKKGVLGMTLNGN